MIRIGLIGEAPNDTVAIQHLLEKRYKDKVEFFLMVKNIRGANLDNQKNKRRIRVEFETEKPDFVLFIRDLDALETDKKAKIQKQEYFTENNSNVNKKGIFLLNIYEIEALILSDIKAFNEFYNQNLEFNEDPMLVEEPKEFLKEKSNNKYKESDCRELFKYLNIEEVAKNCRYFNSFLSKLDKCIS